MNPRCLPCAPRTRVAPPFVAPLTHSGSNFSTMTSLSGGGPRSSFGKYMSDFKTIPAENFYPLQIKVNFSRNDYFNVYIKGPDVDKKSAPNRQNIGSSGSFMNSKPGSISSPPQKSQKVLPDRSSVGGYSNSEALPKVSSELVLLFLHGAGFSALSWALLAKNLSESVPGCYLVAIDLRGHGDSRTADESDFCFETLSDDVCRVYEALVEDGHLPGGGEYSQYESASALPAKVFLVGHSMGGALAAFIGAKRADRLENIVGVCVIDVVEGSAIEALNGMKNVLKSRPKSFASEEEAIEWSVRSGYIKKRESAKISMIGQIITQSEADKRQAASIASAAKKGTHSETTDIQQTRDLGALQEEEEEEADGEQEHQWEPGKKTGTGSPQKTSSTAQYATKISNEYTQPHQVKPYQESATGTEPRSKSTKVTQKGGYPTPYNPDAAVKTGEGQPVASGRDNEVESGHEEKSYGTKSTTVRYTGRHETTKKSVLPKATTMKTEPNYQPMESTTSRKESEKYYDNDEDYQNKYPNCEVLYDIRGEDKNMKINGENEKSKTTQKGSKDDSKDSKNDEEIKDPERYTWRIDLFKTEPYWKSWFTGLSRNFLDSPGPKLLILAGVDRLDNELTVAQMQGKFQMLVLPKAGHAVQEDAPEKVADALATFVQRHRLAPTDSSKYEPVYPGC